MKHILNIASILFLIFSLQVGAVAQNADYTKSVMQGDSVVVRLGEFVGNVQWQQSDDGSTWEDIYGAIQDELLIVAQSSKYYRTMVSVSGCNPYISQTVFVEIPDNVYTEINQDFSTIEHDVDFNYTDWLNIAEKGSRIWRGKIRETDKYVQATAYNSSDAENVCWLISPLIDFDVNANEQLSFKSAQAYWSHNGLSVWVITNLNGNNIAGAEKMQLSPVLADNTSVEHAWVESGSIDLSNLTGKARIAFKYTGNASAGQTGSFRLDDIVVKNVTEIAPVAAFTANQTSITEGQAVSFTDQSTNNPTSWLWDFGDGNTSTLQNPSYTYNSAGTYTVSLTVSNNAGSGTETKTAYITVSGSSTNIYYMSNTTIATCSGTFYDSQGTYNYNNNEDFIMTFTPGVSGKMMQFDFKSFSLEYHSTCGYDYLKIYNGNSTSAALIGTYCGTNTPGVVTASNAQGALTFVFHSDGSQTYAGWEASIACVDGGSSNTVTDYDGNIYQTVQIGNQIWMAENLKTTHYANGTVIPVVEGYYDWNALTYSDKAYCYYDNLSSNGGTFGFLYSWAAAMNGNSSSNNNPSGVQGVCPTGWHLPSDNEWKELEMYLGMSQSDADKVGSYRGTNQASMLAGNATLWDDGVLETNIAFGSSGFDALPGGCRYGDGSFFYLNYYAAWWTSTEENTSNINDIYYRKFYNDETYVSRYLNEKNYGLSVRCVKD